MQKLIILAFVAALCASGEGSLSRQVSIYRDGYGVPHVYGKADAACVFGYIYAQAEDNFLPDFMTIRTSVAWGCIADECATSPTRTSSSDSL